MRGYIWRGTLCAWLVIGSLIALGYLPPMSIAGVELRRVNILSQLGDYATPEGESAEAERSEVKIETTECQVDLKSVAREVAEARDEVRVEKEVEKVAEVVVKSEVAEGEIVPIEEFIRSAEDSIKFSNLYRKLSERRGVVRVALLGDSFVEGDILSCDLRERLQSTYGGEGCGFAPFDSPHTKYRATIKTQSEGWRTHNIMQRDRLTDTLAARWFVSGWLSLPSNGATTRWRTTSAREHISHCSRVRLLFVSRGESQLSISVNGVEPTIYDRKGATKLQQLIISGDSIASLDVEITRGAESFVGYGAIFEGDRGVVLDNYAIRSNNGQAVLWSDPAINAQVDAQLGGYDLVILQYGLNLLQRGVRNYSRYRDQMAGVIGFVGECFPDAAIVVWGVSDRSMRRDGGFEPMSEAQDMISYQRAAADSLGVAFWNTHSAMTTRGGMAQFVKNRWAAKDYTHINAAGGRELGRAFASAVDSAVEAWHPAPIERPIESPLVSASHSEITERINRPRRPKLEGARW